MQRPRSGSENRASRATKTRTEGFTEECWGGRGMGRNEADVERGGQVLEAWLREFTPRTRKCVLFWRAPSCL